MFRLSIVWLGTNVFKWSVHSLFCPLKRILSLATPTSPFLWELMRIPSLLGWFLGSVVQNWDDSRKQNIEEMGWGIFIEKGQNYSQEKKWEKIIGWKEKRRKSRTMKTLTFYKEFCNWWLKARRENMDLMGSSFPYRGHWKWWRWQRRHFILFIFFHLFLLVGG